MGYRELHRMEIEEVVRRWQVHESQRAIARATGLARETVKKYLAAASDLGLSATGPPPAERELVELRRLGVVATQPIMIYTDFQTGQSGNATHYSNPRVDALIAAGVATTDRNQRKMIYQQLQQQLLDDIPWVSLYIANQFEAMQTYVKGYTHIATGTNTAFKDVWLDK